MKFGTIHLKSHHSKEFIRKRTDHRPDNLHQHQQTYMCICYVQDYYVNHVTDNMCVKVEFTPQFTPCTVNKIALATGSGMSTTEDTLHKITSIQAFSNMRCSSNEFLQYKATHYISFGRNNTFSRGSTAQATFLLHFVALHSNEQSLPTAVRTMQHKLLLQPRRFHLEPFYIFATLYMWLKVLKPQFT